MKKTTQKMKVLMLALVMAGLLLPMTTFAQSGGGDSFFRGEADSYNRAGGLSNQTFGNESGGPQAPTDLVPVGSGLFIMLAAGAGYAILKKKED